MTDIDEILSRLNKRTQTAVRRARDIKIERQRLPSLGLTRALAGGLVYGTQTTVWGNRSAGKSAFCLQTIGMAQEDGRACALVDAERAFDPGWASRLGVNNEQLIVTPLASLTDATDACADLIRAGIDLIVVDSISALLPDSFFTDKGELKDASNTGQIGQFSKGMGDFSKMLNSINDHTQIILISQIRTNLGGYHASLQPMGGKGVDHHNSTSIKLWSSTAQSEQITAEVSENGLIFTHPIGRKVTWTLDKARGKGMGQSHHYNFYYNGDFVGIDVIGETLDLAVAHGVVSKGGPGWYTIYGEKFQGDIKAANYLRTHPEILEKVEAELLD